MIKRVKRSSPVLSTRRRAQQGSTYMEWISLTPSARDTLKIYSDRIWFLYDWPIRRRLVGMKKVMNKDLWAYGQYQSDTRIEEKVMKGHGTTSRLIIFWPI